MKTGGRDSDSETFHGNPAGERIPPGKAQPAAGSESGCTGGAHQLPPRIWGRGLTSRQFPTPIPCPHSHALAARRPPSVEDEGGGEQHPEAEQHNPDGLPDRIVHQNDQNGDKTKMGT
jgi:hypothetical protein